jgi:hypothetical protein
MSSTETQTRSSEAVQLSDLHLRTGLLVRRFNDAWGGTYFAVNADGSGDERPIDAVLYHSWRGGWYQCECYG